jgi:hypothetical protein
MADPVLAEVAPGRLGRRPRQIIAALAAFVLCAILYRYAPSATTRGLVQAAMLLALLALAVRIVDNLRHADREVQLATWTATLVLVIALAAPALLEGGAAPLVLYAFAPAVGIAWLLIGAARARWLAAALGRPRGTTLSVSLICKDEADRIGRCLEAVAGWADQIVVLDSGSSDGTVEIARRYTDLVTVTDWPGYGLQKQRALERCRGEWVLSLDADEVISPELKREIDATLSGAHGCRAFRAPWVSVLFGGPIDFGADGRYHTRLFRRDGARFDGAAVHEEVLAAGRVGTLEAPVYHFTFRDRAHLDAKFGEYARLSARTRFAKGRRATRIGALARGAASFLLLYLVRLGLLDGRRGLLMAALYARYTHDKYHALWQLEQQAR